MAKAMDFMERCEPVGLASLVDARKLSRAPISWTLPLHPLRLPGDGDEQLAVAEKALGRAFGVFHRHCRDELVAFVEIFDAKTIRL